MFRFTIRDLLWLTVVMPLVGWSPPQVRAQDVKDLGLLSDANIDPNLAAAKVYRAVQDWDSAAIQQFEQSSTPSIALLAAWRRCKTTSVDSQTAIARFVGFFEGRLRLEVPEFFAKQVFFILDGRSDAIPPKLGNAGPKVVDVRTVSKVVTIGTRPWLFAPEDEVRVTEFGITIKAGGHETMLPRKLFEDAPKRYNQAFWTQAENAAFVLFTDEFGSRSLLACVERTNGQIRWTSKVWAGNAEAIRFKFGSWFNFAYLQVFGGRIAVFGVNGDAYCELFDSKDGRNLARFSASCWNGHIGARGISGEQPR